MLLDGKKIRDEILAELEKTIKGKNIKATLAIILVGDNEASKIYIKNKEKACEKIGITCEKYLLDAKITEEELIKLINDLNANEAINGIILQSPVPSHIDFDKVSGLIDPLKDVDGFTQENIYKLYLNKDSLMPCTVKGIIVLLEKYNIDLKGKKVTIVGRGNIVGHPLSLALLNKDATVTVAHSKTKNLKEVCKDADIIVAATGKAHLITEDYVKEKAIVVDVGVTRIDGHITGDVDFDNIKDKCSYITPNPGGVGPMTVAMIMENVIKAYQMQERRKTNG